MPLFPFGRLFWKFLVFFFLAQVTAVVGVGLAIWAIKHEHDLEAPPPPPFAVERSPDDVRPPPFPHPQGMPPPHHPPKPPVLQLLAGAAVSLIFAALLAAYVARPIRRLRQAMQAGASGKLTPGLSEAMGHRNDELADLCRDFDRMAQHLAQLMEGQRRLLHDVSHELRSPLARLTAVIGLARQQPDRLEDCLARLERESERMDRLLSELLTLSRLESGMIERVNEIVDLTELLRDVVSDLTPEAGQAGCEVELGVGTETTEVRGDPEMLHRLFDNLLRNALRYAAQGKWVRIGLSALEREVCVLVEDRGPGVLSSELDRIFLPFYRGSQSAGGNGHGLGLVIARQIVEKHGGRIEAANRPARRSATKCLPAFGARC